MRRDIESSEDCHLYGANQKNGVSLLDQKIRKFFDQNVISRLENWQEQLFKGTYIVLKQNSVRSALEVCEVVCQPRSSYEKLHKAKEVMVAENYSALYWQGILRSDRRVSKTPFTGRALSLITATR